MGVVALTNVSLSNARKVFFMVIGFCVLAFSAAMSVKANIGVNSGDAIALVLSEILNIKLGTVIMYINLGFVAVQWLILKDRFRFRHVLQIVASLILGNLVNLFYYVLWNKIVIELYLLRFLLMLVSQAIGSAAVSFLISLNYISIPLDGCCSTIAHSIGKPYGMVRQLLDLSFIILSALLAIVSKTDFPIREGTLVGMLIFGPLVEFWTPHINKLFFFRRKNEIQ